MRSSVLIPSNVSCHTREAELIAPKPLKILIYSHDTYGLGHIRRCLAIARSLRKCPADILIVTGSLLAGRFKIPRRVDFVRVPGMIKVTNEEYRPLSMKLDATELLEIRKKIILSTAMAFLPDFFIVDKAPLGMKREIVETLQGLQSDCPSCHSILGLRDIMDSASSTIEDWSAKGIYEAMDQMYNEIWVYGCQDFYDTVAEYKVPAHVAEKMHFTGYIPRQLPSQEEVQSTRRALGIRDGEKLVLVTTGGGGDGQPVVNAFLSAFSPTDVRIPSGLKVVVVTGPFISPRDYKEVARRCQAMGFTTLKFHRFMEALIGAAQVVVSMGGYNTICEIISQRKPFLIVPRTEPREEQLIRARVLSNKGFCDYLDPRDLTPHNLLRKILKLLENGSAYQEKMTSFPFTGLDVMRSRILEHTGRILQ